MDKMQVTVENLGAVKKGTFELKPLTVFVGKNNTGKTRTAYLVSSLLSVVGGYYYTDMYVEGLTDTKYSVIEQVVDDVIKTGSSGINLLEFFSGSDFPKFLNDVITSSKKWFKRFMATSISINDYSVSISFDNRLDEYANRLLQLKREDGIGFGSNSNLNQRGKLNVKKDTNDPNLYFYTTEANIENKLPLSIIRRFVIGNIFMAVLNSFFNNVYYFPAERTGIVALETSGSIIEKLDEHVKPGNYKKLWLSVPIADLINNNRKYRDATYRAKCNNDTKKSDREIYNKLSFILEKCILSGNFDFTEPEQDGISDFIFRYNGSIDLDMPLTSSSVKELMNLALYLRFEASNNDLLIIDEPEINLHPYAQAQFVELVGMMVNAGLKIIITTHSPYIVDHLSNLIKAKKKASNQNLNEIKKLFYLRNSDAFISHDKTGIYLFHDSKICPILNNSGVIDWRTFSKVSEDLVRIDYKLNRMDDT